MDITFKGVKEEKQCYRVLTSFCYRICQIARWSGVMQTGVCLSSTLVKMLDMSDEISHPAELSNAGVGGLSQTLGLNRRLTEEEKYLVVIRVFTFRDPKGTHKFWFW